MIYTSYFAKLRTLPKNIIPISICAKTPDWYNGLQYKKLAPKYDFFKKWKENHDNDYYIKCFEEQVLGKLDAHEVVRELDSLMTDVVTSIDYGFELSCGTPQFVLICYEKPSDFCHRHLVAKWLNDNGFECGEWGIDDEKM